MCRGTVFLCFVRMTAVRLGIDLQQVLELLAPLIPAA